jgi:hypothetical protein
VRLAVEKRGIRAAADAGVKGVDGCDLVSCHLEVEDVDVLGDSVWLHGLRNRAEPVLDVPAEDDLGGGLAVLLRQFDDDRIL